MPRRPKRSRNATRSICAPPIDARAPYIRAHLENDPLAWRIPAPLSKYVESGASHHTRCDSGTTTAPKCRRYSATCIKAAGSELETASAFARSRSVVRIGVLAVL